MSKIDDFFDTKSIEKISEIVGQEMSTLNELQDFRDKDKMLCVCIEEFKNLLTGDLSEKFDKIQKLSYQLDKYYFTLAYILGSKNAKKFGQI